MAVEIANRDVESWDETLRQLKELAAKNGTVLVEVKVASFDGPSLIVRTGLGNRVAAQYPAEVQNWLADFVSFGVFCDEALAARS